MKTKMFLVLLAVLILCGPGCAYCKRTLSSDGTDGYPRTNFDDFHPSATVIYWDPWVDPSSRSR